MQLYNHEQITIVIRQSPMNRDLFINGFIDRIGKRFGLTADFAFEILAISAVLDQTFDEVMDNVFCLDNGSGSHDGGMDGVFIERSFCRSCGDHLS